MSIFVDENTKVIVPGPHRRRRAASTACATATTAPRSSAGTNPKKAGTDVEGIPVFAIGRRRGRRDRRHRVVHLRARARARGRGAGGGRGRHRVHRRASPRASPRRTRRWFYNKLQARLPERRGCSARTAPASSAPASATSASPPAEIAKAGGPVGIVSRSGTLTYQALYELEAEGHRRDDVRRHRRRPGARAPASSTASSAFEADPETKAVMMIGEIGGSAEEEAAEFIKADDDEAGRRLHRRRHRARRARRWATPAPSSRAARAPPQAKMDALRGRRRAGRRSTPPRPAS